MENLRGDKGDDGTREMRRRADSLALTGAVHLTLYRMQVPVTTAAHGALDYFPDKATGLHDASSRYMCNPQ